VVEPSGAKLRNITFDPFSRQWIYVLTRGSYGLLRSPQGWIDDRVLLSGNMTMIGINCEWRMTWTKISEDEFGFLNEQIGAGGGWEHIDEWQFARKPVREI